MLSLATNCLVAFALTLTSSVHAQSTNTPTTTSSSDGDGYVGYNLTLEGDQDSVIYSTENTRPDAGQNYTNPDVFLNASVSVGEIDIEVDNLSAKVNLDLQVLKLLDFNAGVDVSIDTVKLMIENVTAKVLLEARLGNVLNMVENVLDSIDLNPVIATLGEDVGEIVNTTAGAVGGALGGGSGSSSGSGSSQAEKRSYELEQNILYSVNNYSGDTHTNRILAQNGDIVEQDLDNDGNRAGSRVVGSYDRDMKFTGHEDQVERDGETVTSRQYEYAPFPGLEVISAIYVGGDGEVVGTRVLSELEGGGSSTISDL